MVKFKSKKMRLTLLMILAMITWGLSWTNAKILGNYGNAPLMMFWRFFIATISFAPIVWLKKESFKISKEALHFIILNSIFMTSYNFFYFKGTQVGLAGEGGVLVTTLNPILTTLFSALFFGGILLRKDIVGLMLGFFGGACILKIWDLNLDLLFQSGNFHFIMASLSWVSVTILTSRSKSVIPFIPYSFWCFALSAIFSLFIAVNEPLLDVFQFDWIFWLNMMCLAVAAMAFGTSVYFQASVELGAKKASAYIFTVPLTAMGFAMYYLGEPLMITTLFGGTLGVAAVYLINK
jgi:drug/metabolite transporter (DMT)-like permease